MEYPLRKQAHQAHALKSHKISTVNIDIVAVPMNMTRIKKTLELFSKMKVIVVTYTMRKMGLRKNLIKNIRICPNSLMTLRIC